MTGVGKGLFNCFVGACLFVSDAKEGDSGVSLDEILGFAMFGAGGVFLFLSLVKKMSDEELLNAV